MLKLLKLSAFVLGFCTANLCFGASTDYPVVINSKTVEIMSSLNARAKTAQVSKLPLGQVIQWTALQLIGQPYAKGLLDRKTPEYLYISLADTDCMLFVEEAVATGSLIKKNQLDVDNLAKYIKELRYHGNVSYCERNHYFKDWALDNKSKNIVIDEAYPLTEAAFPFKAHVMSDKLGRNSSDIHADDLACITQREQQINQQQLGYIPLKDLKKNLQYIQAGDIIGIVRDSSGRADAVHHLGIAYVKSGRPVGMIHASSEAGIVVLAESLEGYLAKFKDSQGIILLRVTKQ